MFDSYQCFQYKCLNCLSILEKMASEQPEDTEKCTACLKKENNTPVRFILDGAPSGFVKGGVSNKAGFSSGKSFNK